MKIDEELKQAQDWVSSLSEHEKKNIEGVASFLSKALVESQPEHPVTLGQILARQIQTSLGSLKDMVLSDEEKIERYVYENLLLLLFRFHVFFASRSDVLTTFLEQVEQFFVCFREFVESVQAKKKVDYSLHKVQALSHRLISFLLTVAFPEEEKSFHLPVPFFARGMVDPYLKKAYHSFKEKGADFLTQFLLSSDSKASLLFLCLSFLHQKFTSWDFSSVTVLFLKESVPVERYEKLEKIIQEACFCLTLDGERLSSLCPKYRLSQALMPFLYTFCAHFDKNMTSLSIHGIYQLVCEPISFNKKSAKEMLHELEARLCDKEQYVPLYYRLAKSSTPLKHVSHAPHFIQTIIYGFINDFMDRSFESQPWDEIFSFLSFGVRRSWNFFLSNDFLLYLETRDIS